MIPLTATAEDQARYITNIINTYKKTSREQRERGNAWYPNALSLCRFLDASNPQRAAGVLAALSANKRWADNVDLAMKAFTVGPEGHLPDALEKVRKILAGASPLDVLPQGRKTWWFYVCIVDPDHPTGVVVDRHAHDVAVGRQYGDSNRGLSTVKRYDIIADAYREAARKLGLQPMVLQATVWLAVTEGTNKK